MGAQPALALPLPIRAEPLVERSAQHDPRSRYPAKRSKHLVAAPVPLRGPCPSALPIVGNFCAPVDPVALECAPVLLLTFRPAAPSTEDLGLDWFDFIDDEQDAAEALWHMDYLARAQPVAIVMPKPRPAPAPPELPLPRNASVTPWKKRGPFEAIAYWLRKRLFARSPGKASLAKLRAENSRLRRQLAHLSAHPA